MIDQSCWPVVERPASVGNHDTGRIVPAESRGNEFEGAFLRAPIERAFAADRPKFLAEPRIDRGRRDGPITGPAQFRVLQREWREEGTAFHRPAPRRGRNGT